MLDIHPDPFYEIHSDPDNGACHSKHGSAGFYGAETTDCDSPYSLVNATFKWIEENLKDQIDFVIWTGDSARHDNDEDFPRSEKQVLGQNQYLMDKMLEVFGKSGKNHVNAFEIPIIPTIGNNDVLPHNIFTKGPNKWTKHYSQMWKKLIPEEQRHQFERGGWFYVEVIPEKLAVFSLNTLFFFTSNAAVDGCEAHSEPGYEHMEWLRIQLQFLRERGMKAIMTGHVPPARNDEKANWDETCWQKYTLWMRQYRDVVIGAMWGHMNIEHFLLHDFHDIEYNVERGHGMLADHRYHGLATGSDGDGDGDEIIHVAKASNYLASLRNQWSKLPGQPSTHSKIDQDELEGERKRKRRRKTEKQYYKEVGGEWAERFAISYVSPSVIPNYFPSLRVFEYNITGLEDVSVGTNPSQIATSDSSEQDLISLNERELDDDIPPDDTTQPQPEQNHSMTESKRKRKHKNKKKKHPKRQKPKFTVPLPPPATAPPGPAYSPQPLAWLGYTQYYANLTRINNEPPNVFSSAKRKSGKHRETVHPEKFEFEVEYDTRDTGDVYDLGDGGLIVRNMLNLASRVGRYKPEKGDELVSPTIDDEQSPNNTSISTSTSKSIEASSSSNTETHDSQMQHDYIDTEKKKMKKKGKKHHKHKRRRIINRTWFAFVDRALVGTASEEELQRDFGQEVED